MGTSRRISSGRIMLALAALASGCAATARDNPMKGHAAASLAGGKSCATSRLGRCAADRGKARPRLHPGEAVAAAGAPHDSARHHGTDQLAP